MEPPFLQIVTPPGRESIPLGPAALTIGRHQDNKIALNQDDLASRFHGVIEPAPGGYQFRDLGSRNGTWVNGVLVKNALLRHGDVIAIGRAVLKVVLPAPSVVAETPGGVGGGVIPPQDEVLEIDPAQIVPEIIIEEAAPEEAPEETTDPAAILRRLAEAIPDQPFTENDIVLTNARGGVMHPAAGETGARVGGGGEAVTLFRLLLLLCFRSRASDIHIEPKESHFHIRIRVDGAMIDITRIPKELGIRVMAMVKVLGDIDIAQRNIVQEGHFSSRVPKSAGTAGDGTGGVRR
ncbi:MAG: ATPase, T2SS/T4P/T4SS family, partial [Phycisphaerae bacterium]